MALNPRERKIAIFLGAMGALVVVYYAGGALMKPFVQPREEVAQKQAKLRKVRKELATARADLADYAKLCGRIPEAPEGSAKLDDIERTRHHLRSEIDRLLELPGMKKLDIEKFDKIKDNKFKPKKKKLKRRGPQYTVLTYSLRGRGDLPSVMRLLLEIYRLEDLIYVTQLRLDPVKVKGAKKVAEVDIDIKLQSLVVERDPKLLEEAQKPKGGKKRARSGKPEADEGHTVAEKDETPADSPAQDAVARKDEGDKTSTPPAADGNDTPGKPATARRDPRKPAPGQDPKSKPGKAIDERSIDDLDKPPAVARQAGEPQEPARSGPKKAGTPIRPEPRRPAPSKTPAKTEDVEADTDARPSRLAMAEFKYNELVQWAPFDQYVKQVAVTPPPKPPKKTTKPPKNNKPPKKTTPEPPVDTGPPPPDLNWIVKGFVGGVIQEVLIVRGEQQPASTTRRGGRSNQRLGSSSRAGRSGGRRNQAPAEPEGPSTRYARLGEEFGDGVLVMVHRLGVVVSKKNNELWFIRYGKSMTEAEMLSTSGYREVQLAMEMNPPRITVRDPEGSSESGEVSPPGNAGNTPAQDLGAAAGPNNDTETPQPEATRSQPAKTGATPKRPGRSRRTRGK